MGSIPGLGGSSAVGNGNPLQYSCLDNPMDRGAWWSTAHGVTKSWTQLSMHKANAKCCCKWKIFILFKWLSSVALYICVCVCMCVYVCAHVHACLVTHSCLTLCDLLDCSPPGFSVHGIFQARILEWVSISSSRRSS